MREFILCVCLLGAIAGAAALIYVDSRSVAARGGYMGHDVPNILRDIRQAELSSARAQWQQVYWAKQQANALHKLADATE